MYMLLPGPSPSLVLFLVALLLLEELRGRASACQHPLEPNLQTARGEDDTHLDERLGRLEEVLPALRLRALLVPIDDRLVRDTVLVVQNLVGRGRELDSTAAKREKKSSPLGFEGMP